MLQASYKSTVFQVSQEERLRPSTPTVFTA
jgi:hypothetical protein